MCMTRLRQRGFTLIELIIFIVVVAAGLAGILSVMNSVVKSSADPMVRKQAMALADSILEEILLKSYCDPDTVIVNPPNPPACGANTVESGRDTYDDVDDFKDISEVISATGPIFLNMPEGLYGYRIRIALEVPPAAAAKLGTLDAKRVTVTVSRGPESISLTGYRTNY